MVGAYAGPRVQSTILVTQMRLFYLSGLVRQGEVSPAKQSKTS